MMWKAVFGTYKNFAPIQAPKARWRTLWFLNGTRRLLTVEVVAHKNSKYRNIKWNQSNIDV